MNDTIQSLYRQLSETKENLHLIEEHKAEFVQETDIPLQLIKEERRTREKITDLQQRIDASTSNKEDDVKPSDTKTWAIVTVLVAVIGVCGTTIATMMNPDLLKWIFAPVTPTVIVTDTTTPIPPASPSHSNSEPPVALAIRDLWPTATGCKIGGTWWTDLWVQPVGGNGTYTYYINGDWKAGPITEGVTIHLETSTCTTMVSTMAVESGGQIESREFFIDVPDCCGQ